MTRSGALYWRRLYWLLALASAPAAHAITPEPSHTRTSTPTPSATATVTPTPSLTATVTPVLVADANCDGTGSAPDFAAAIIVSSDGSKLPACRGADSFRDRPLTSDDVVALLQDIFRAFDQPWTPTPTTPPTITPTGTKTGTRTATVATTPTATASATSTETASSTATSTSSPSPSRTATAASTRTVTPTSTLSPTRTPTGIAYQLSGRWLAHWTGQICYLNGQPFQHLSDTTYRVAALDGQLDIQVVGGVSIGRGLTVGSDGAVSFRYRVFDQSICLPKGDPKEFVFDYAFTFRTNGTGSATAHWTYGFNTNCAVCEVPNDTATLTRLSGPGT